MIPKLFYVDTCLSKKRSLPSFCFIFLYIQGISLERLFFLKMQRKLFFEGLVRADGFGCMFMDPTIVTGKHRIPPNTIAVNVILS